MNNDSDGAHLTSFGIEFQTADMIMITQTKERSPHVALLYADLLRRGMVCGLERVSRVCDDFYEAYQ